MADMHVMAMGHKMYRTEPLTEKEKARNRAANGVKARWAEDAPVTSEVKKVREYLAPTTHKISSRKKFGRSGCRMSHANKLALLARCDARTAFFKALRGE